VGYRTLIAFQAEEQGSTAIEYGLIAALVVLVMLFGLATMADAMNAMYSESDGSLTTTIKEAGS
jgi:Flp pilus assembly pilin Flp